MTLDAFERMFVELGSSPTSLPFRPPISGKWTGEIEQYALLVASLCHDIGHFGRTNQFLVEIKHAPWRRMVGMVSDPSGRAEILAIDHNLAHKKSQKNAELCWVPWKYPVGSIERTTDDVVLLTGGLALAFFCDFWWVFRRTGVESNHTVHLCQFTQDSHECRCWWTVHVNVLSTPDIGPTHQTHGYSMSVCHM